MPSSGFRWPTSPANTISRSAPAIRWPRSFSASRPSLTRRSTSRLPTTARSIPTPATCRASSPRRRARKRRATTTPTNRSTSISFVRSAASTPAVSAAAACSTASRGGRTAAWISRRPRARRYARRAPARSSSSATSSSAVTWSTSITARA